jgi:hypothetical protein
VQKASTLAWDERESVGMWRSFWRTSVAMMSHPIQTLTTARADAPLGSSILFSVLALVAGMGPTLAIYAGIFGVVGLTMPTSDLKLGSSAVFIPLAIIFYVILLFMLQVAGLLFTAGLDHVALMMLGERPRAYAVSVRAGALAMGPYLIGLVPVCGIYVFPIWSIVLRIFAVMHLHNVSAGKATAAVLLPLVLLCGFCGATYAALIMAVGLNGN